MCVSLAPARFTGTTLYAAEASRDGKPVHVLGYQNRVQNLYRQAIAVDGDDWDWKNPQGKPKKGSGTGNAMILPIPALPGSMNHANVLDTSACRNILKDMAEAVRPRRRGGMRGADSMSFGAVAKSVQVFDHDIYTVVLATDATAIPSALGRVPDGKRPALNAAIFDAYAAWYPDWTVALCCFNNSEAAEAAPLLWWYEPMSPEFLFAPALDGHSGGLPDLTSDVDTDHSVIVSASGIRGGQPVSYRDSLPANVAQLAAQQVVGGQFNSSMPNGDFVCRLADVKAGRFQPKRLPPPGAQR